MSNPFHPDRDSAALPGASFADEATADDQHDAFTQRATGEVRYSTDLHRGAGEHPPTDIAKRPV